MHSALNTPQEPQIGPGLGRGCSLLRGWKQRGLPEPGIGHNEGQHKDWAKVRYPRFQLHGTQEGMEAGRLPTMSCTGRPPLVLAEIPVGNYETGQRSGCWMLPIF